MSQTESMIVFSLLFLTVAFLYSSVGHGGASGYLALMAFLNFTPGISKISALLINIIVSSIAFYQYYRSNHFRRQLFIPFAIGSIPLAYVGSQFVIDAHMYKIILGVFVLLAGMGLLFMLNKSNYVRKEVNPYYALAIGCIIGFISGIIGIGGGIFLSPIILMIGWGSAKETAAVSSLFILVNSLSGVMGVLMHPLGKQMVAVIPFMLAATVGGIGGSYYGSKKLSNNAVKKMLGVVLLIAGFKLVSGS